MIETAPTTARRRAGEVARRLGLAALLVAVYVGVLSPLRIATARHAMAPLVARVAPSGTRVAATPRPPSVAVDIPGAPARRLDVPFGRLWIVTALALALLGAPRRAHAHLAAAVAALGALSLGVALAGASGLDAAWALHAFLGVITLPVVAGTALLATRRPASP